MPLVAARIDRTSGTSLRAGLATALLFVGLAMFGARYHWVEEAGTAERDGYVSQAEQLLAGELPKDPFRPPLYPLLVAGLGRAIADPFAAARLISNLAAACLTWIAWRTGRELGGGLAEQPKTESTGKTGGETIGSWAFVATAVNPNLWILGQHTTTDMTFGALAAGTLLAGLIYLKRPGPRPACVAGALLGLAAFTRGNAIFLLPGLLVAFWMAGKTWSSRLRHLTYAGLAALPGYVALWTWRYVTFGDLFRDDNWKNVAWKLYGYPDWSYLDRVPFHGLGEIVRTDPLGILKGGFSELARFAESGLAQLVGTPLHAVLFVAAGLWLIWRKDREAGWLLGAGFVFLAAAAFSFFTWGRLLLCLLPATNAVLFAALFSASVRAEASSAPTSAKPGSAGSLPQKLALAVAAALVLSLGAKTAFRRLPAFADRHPYLEIAILRHLEQSLPPGARLGGTSPFVGRYLHHPYVGIPDAFGPELREPRLYLERLERLARTERISYLVVGELDLRDRPKGLLGPKPPAPWLVPIERGAGVAAWRVR
ncbi:MAG: hypothetical protein ABJC13_09030 [Acidobacteriota bacterium]